MGFFTLSQRNGADPPPRSTLNLWGSGTALLVWTKCPSQNYILSKVYSLIKVTSCTFNQNQAFGRDKTEKKGKSDPSGDDSWDRSDHQPTRNHGDSSRTVKLALLPVRYTVSERVYGLGNGKIPPPREPCRIGLYTQRNGLISPLIYTANIGAESLAGHGWYRNTAAATDGEIRRNLSD